MNAHRVRAGLALCLCLCMLAAPAWASVRAWLSSPQIAPGNTVELTLQYNGLTMTEPNLAPLRRNFDILGTRSSTSVQIGNGGSSENTQVVLTLSPKHAGRLTIPPIAWDGEHSPALTLTVSASNSGSSAAGSPASGAAAPGAVFIVSRISPAHPYVQEQVGLVVRIYTNEQLYQGRLTFSGNGAVLVKRIGHDQYGNAVRGGHSYQVITRRYVLFPLRSGTVRLAGPVLNAQAAVAQRSTPWGNNPFGGFFGNLLRTARPIQVRGDPIILSVRPRPASQGRGGYWLPAQKVTLSAQWSPTRLQVRAGSPVSVTLDLKATGLTAGQLPDLAHLITPPAGLSAYPDRPHLHNTAQGNNMVGARDQTLAFIANRPGHYTVPGLTIHWWDTQTNRARTLAVPGRTLTILPAPGGTGAAASAAAAPPAARESPPPAPTLKHNEPPRPASGRAGRFWQWVSAGLGVLWLATVGAWVASSRARRPRRAAAAPVKRPAPLDPARERAAFHAACARNEPRAARRHLLGWAAAVWNTRQTTLREVAEATGRAELSERLRELERACYGDGRWEGEPLARLLTELPARPRDATPRDEPLPPLYS